MVFSESQKEYDNIYIQKGGEDYSQLKSEIDELNSRYDSIQKQLKDMQEAYKNREVSDDDFLYAVNAAQTLKYAIQNKEELINKIDYLANIENQYNKKDGLSLTGDMSSFLESMADLGNVYLSDLWLQ